MISIGFSSVNASSIRPKGLVLTLSPGSNTKPAIPRLSALDYERARGVDPDPTLQRPQQVRHSNLCLSNNL